MFHEVDNTLFQSQRMTISPREILHKNLQNVATALGTAEIWKRVEYIVGAYSLIDFTCNLWLYLHITSIYKI